MKFIRKHLSTIIISLAIGVFLFYIQPILGYLGNAIVNIFLFTSAKFSEMYYQTIAKNNPYVFDELNNYILIFGLIIFLVYMLRNIIKMKDELRRKAANTLERIKNLKDKIEDPDKEKKDFDKEQTLKELTELEASAENQKLTLEKRDNKIIAISILTFFLAVLLIFNYIFNTSVSKENNRFRNKTIILLPYIGQDSINKLISSWALMKNSVDHQRIISKIDSVEKKYFKK